MTDILLLLPIIIPMASGILCLFARYQARVQRAIVLLGTSALFLSGVAILDTVNKQGIIATQMGGWEAPFGITFVADTFSAVMIVLTGLVGVSVAMFSFANEDEQRRRFGYYPTMMILLMGVSGAFLTGDLFNMYVWFEVLLIASFVLMALGNERAQLEGALKYFAINLVKSSLFLASLGIIYGLAGTLNMADLAVTLPTLQNQGMVSVIGMFLMIAFGIKAAVFPLFFWLPSSYHTPPVTVTTLFSGLMTKVGVYALVRVFTLIFVQETDFTHTILLWVAGLTMIVGVLGAVAQYDFRRLLSFHIISQIGYLIMGLGVFTVGSLAGLVYFMAHVIIAKSALFLTSGITYQIAGTYNLKKLGGFYRGYPLLAFLFFVPAMSLGGIPPLSGFWAKYGLVASALEAQQYLIVAVGLGVSVLTMYSMTKIWAEAFWKESPQISEDVITQKALALPFWNKVSLFLPLILMVVLTVVMGLAADTFLAIAQQAGEQLMNPQGYIQAVLGVVP